MSTKNIARSFVEPGQCNHAKYAKRFQKKADKLHTKKLITFACEDLIESKTVKSVWGRENKYNYNCLKRFLASHEGQNFSDVRQLLHAKIDSRTEVGRILFRHLNTYGWQAPYEVLHRSAGEVFVDSDSIIRVHKIKVASKKHKSFSQKELSDFLKNRKVLLLNNKYYWGLPNQKSEIKIDVLSHLTNVYYLIEDKVYSSVSAKMEYKMIPESDWWFSKRITYRQGPELSMSEITFFNSIDARLQQQIVKGY